MILRKKQVVKIIFIKNKYMGSLINIALPSKHEHI